MRKESMRPMPPADLPPDLSSIPPSRRGFNWASLWGALIIIGAFVLLMAISAKYGMLPSN